MLRFKDIIIEEKVKIHCNKGLNFSFNHYKNHTLKDKLKRANINEKEFKKILNRVAKKIKSDKLITGKYGFCTKKINIPIEYDHSKKEVNIKTILRKNMALKDNNTIYIESFKYELI